MAPKQRTLIQKISIWLSITSVLVGAFACAMYTVSFTFCEWVGGTALAVFLGFWACRAYWFQYKLIRGAFSEVAVASMPIPTPVEIELQLRREGHNPSLSDIAAVHQMLSSRRNEAAVNAGVTLGGLYLINHHTSQVSKGQ
jgi:hypothetical protein